jgi:Fe-S-cluster containining protein
MARRGKAPARRQRTPKSAKRVGSDLCLRCGLCCDGTLFGNITIDEGERDEVSSFGLDVGQDDRGVLVVAQPCAAFVDGCCSLYGVGRPRTCGTYNCWLVHDYQEGTRDIVDALVVVGLVRSVVREIEVEAGMAAGSYSEAALRAYFRDVEPWNHPEEHVRLLIAYHRLWQLGTKYFHYKSDAGQDKAAAAGEGLALRTG